jgi:malonyl-CoA O-methyltransferase
MLKEIIRRNFSRYAYLYDGYADIQRQAAAELAGGIGHNGLRDILELGCGTGNYTAILRDKFKDARIRALDISAEMVVVAGKKLAGKGIAFLVADAENITFRKPFDLITSNACFQWLADLTGALIRYKAMLKSGGSVTFSIFGPRTFCELQESLRQILKGASIEAPNFIAKDSLQVILRDNFKETRIKEVCYGETFKDLKCLLEKIKYSGIRGGGLGVNAHFTRGLLEKIEEAYLKRFGRIEATYEVFFCEGRS